MSVCVTVRCPSVRSSVRLSVPSINSGSDVQLVCGSSGAGGRYRSTAAGAAYQAIHRYLSPALAAASVMLTAAQTATRSVQPRNVGNNRLHLVLYISLMAIWPNNSSSSSTVNIELATAHYRAQNGHAWSVLVGTATSNNHTTMMMMMMMIAAAAAAAVYYYNQQSAVACSCQYSDM